MVYIIIASFIDTILCSILQMLFLCYRIASGDCISLHSMNQHLLIGTSLDAAHSSRDQAAHDTTKQKDDEAEKTEHNGDEPEGELVTLAVDVKVPVLFQLF